MHDVPSFEHLLLILHPRAFPSREHQTPLGSARRSLKGRGQFAGFSPKLVSRKDHNSRSCLKRRQLAVSGNLKEVGALTKGEGFSGFDDLVPKQLMVFKPSQPVDPFVGVRPLWLWDEHSEEGPGPC
jgi:hypothetical protein